MDDFHKPVWLNKEPSLHTISKSESPQSTFHIQNVCIVWTLTSDYLKKKKITIANKFCIQESRVTLKNVSPVHLSSISSQAKYYSIKRLLFPAVFTYFWKGYLHFNRNIWGEKVKMC